MLITLRQLEYVIAVAETGSFSKAAERCSAEQSTVSQQVRTLEERLGVSLFDRSSLPVKITSDGRMVVEKAKDILARVDGLVKPFRTNK